MMLTKEALQEQVHAVPKWFHSIDLGQGVVTPGHKSPECHKAELDAMRLPDLRDKTVLDIGAWDGFYSFAAEKRGARRVVALDHFVWSIHWPSLNGYQGDARRILSSPERYQRSSAIWRPEELPGRAGFELAHQALGSRVEPVVADFMTTDLEKLGTFDVVLYLGVLYHMRNPLEALERLANVTRELAVIETHAVYCPGQEHRAVCEFYEADELNHDSTNWWGPNLTALIAMCRAAGFQHVETLQGPPTFHGQDIQHYRAIVHAWKKRPARVPERNDSPPAKQSTALGERTHLGTLSKVVRSLAKWSERFRETDRATETDIENCYRNLLHRQPDPEGLANWMKLVKSKRMGLRELWDGFVGSQEFQEKHRTP